MGLTLAVGLVVDDAIVMLENIVRHMEEDGLSAFDAALKGSREIGFTILSISISLVAVFIPVLLMGGVIGRIFNEFAVVVTVAILASAFVSLTLTPMLCSRLLLVATPERPGETRRRRLAPSSGFDAASCAATTAGCRLSACASSRSIAARLSSPRALVTVWLLHGYAKGLLPAGGYRPALRSRPRRGRTSPSTRCSSCRARWPRSSSSSPYVAACRRRSGGSGGGSGAGAQRRPALRRARSRRTSGRTLQTVLADLAAAARRRSPASTPYMTPVQNLQHRRALVQEPVPARGAGPRPGADERVGA